MKILLVEDTRAIATLMAHRLGSYGHAVDIAANGRIAVEMFEANDYELVLMDIEMPEMNGFEATNRMRAIEATRQWAWTPVVFLTASDTQENLVTAIEAGGDDFLAKTVPEVVLQAKMKAMTRIAALRQRLSIANKKLEEQASRDGLTGLCNRRYMDLRLDAAWDDAVRGNKPFGLLMIDIDNFKKYNDRYGHQAGDDCLRAVALAIDGVVAAASANGFAADAFAARYGGEEFAVVAPNALDAALEDMADLLVETVCRQQIEHVANASWGVVTISVGGAHRAVASGPIKELFRTADQRLYLAKQQGRNRAVIGDAD